MRTCDKTDVALPLAPRNEEETTVLLQEALGMAATTGLLMRSAGGSRTDSAHVKPAFCHAPVCLLPNALPVQEYVKARRLATIWNLLVARIAHDGPWLLQTLASVLPHDEFTRRLVEIFQAINGAGRDVQKIQLGITRSDYMLHAGESGSGSPELKQVEINTIAASFGCLSTQVTRLHQYLVQKVLGHSRLSSKSFILPHNETMRGLAHGLAAAHKEYLRQESVMFKPSQPSRPGRRPCVLMLVQADERNINDQKLLEICLWEEFGVLLHRATLLEVARNAHLDLQRRQNLLLVSPLISDTGEEDVQEAEVEVTVAYFRAGYDPSDYSSEGEWKGRELIEMSAAIKCPSISHHLAGTKKVQEALCRPGVLERFLKDAEDVDAIRNCFVGLYGLDPECEGATAAVAAACNSPQHFVLKPQREGGGHNLYDQDLVEALSQMTAEERAAYILMEKIRPPPFEAFFLRDCSVLRGLAVLELGVYGVYLGDGEGKRVILNESVGHLLRTKLASSHEGGVAAGFAVLSSPLLVGGGEDSGILSKKYFSTSRDFTMSARVWRRQRFWKIGATGIAFWGVGLFLTYIAVSKRSGKLQ